MIRTLLSAKPVRRLVIEQVVLLILCVGAIMGIGYARAYAALERSFFQSALTSIEQLPTSVSHQADVQQAMIDHQHDYERIFELLQSADTVNEVVGAIESLAVKHSVVVSIPRIVEPTPPKGKKGEPAPKPIGTVKHKHAGTIAFDVAIEGAPVDLLQFIHGLEHASFLGHIISWELNSTGARGRSPSTVIGNARVPAGAPGQSETPIVAPRGSALLTLHVTIHKPQTDEAE